MIRCKSISTEPPTWMCTNLGYVNCAARQYCKMSDTPVWTSVWAIALRLLEINALSGCCEPLDVFWTEEILIGTAVQDSLCLYHWHQPLSKKCCYGFWDASFMNRVKNVWCEEGRQCEPGRLFQLLKWAFQKTLHERKKSCHGDWGIAWIKEGGGH